MSKNLIIVYGKDGESTEVKTRLAKGLGREKAKEIYLFLVERIMNCLRDYEADVWCSFPDVIPESDLWKAVSKQRILQKQGDLGEKMKEDFRRGFAEEYNKVILIGTDIPDLNQIILNQAFQLLDTEDIVLGPTSDGGYYLIGMKSINQKTESLFNNIDWSTNRVYNQTVSKIKDNKLSFGQLTSLIDIDTTDDWEAWSKGKGLTF